MATAKAPLNTSPAAVVSIALPVRREMLLLFIMDEQAPLVTHSDDYILDSLFQ